MGRFVYFKNDPCPGCGRKNEGCKHSPDGRLIQCIRVHSAADTPEGLHFQKISGDFGQLIRKDNQAGGVVFPFRPKESKPQPVSKHLSIVERAIDYRKLAAQLTLDEKSQSWVERKGLPREAALRLGLKTYTPQTRVTGLSPLLPGVNPDNPSRLLPARAGGILLPMRDVFGEVLAYQITPLKRVEVELSGGKWSEADGGKYKWFSSYNYESKDKVWIGQGPGLPDPYNHTPLAYWKPQTLNPAYADTLVFVEGPLKGAITSERGGLHVLGAPGGRFTNPDGTLCLQAEETIQHLNSNRFILAVDAGMISNPQIAKKYFDLSKALEAKGRELGILWWGQLTKADPDIDELIVAGKLAQAEILTNDEYLLLHDKAIQEKLDKHKAKGFNLRVRRKEPVSKAKPVNIEIRRPELAQTIEQWLESGEAGKVGLVQDGCGTGKTTAMIQALKQFKSKTPKKGKKGRKRLFLVPKTIEQALTLEAGMEGDAFYLPGRDENPESRTYCKEYKIFSQLAEAGHNATKDFCASICAPQMAALQSHSSPYLTEHPCPYIREKAKAEKANIVIQTQAAVLSDSSAVEKATHVVVEEDITQSGVVSETVFTYETLTSLMRAANEYHSEYYPHNAPIWSLFQSLQAMIVKGQSLKANEVLDASTEFKAAYSGSLAEVFQAEAGSPAGEDTFRFESCHITRGGNVDTDRLQKKVLKHLLDALTDGKERSVITSKGIVFYRARKAWELLQTKRVMNLDATAPIDLFIDVWGKDNVNIHGQGGIPANVEITQVTGSLFNPATVRAHPDRLKALNRLVNHYASKLKKPLLVSQRSLIGESWLKDGLEPPLAKILNCLNKNTTGIWYGNQTRASNSYQDHDGLIIAGSFIPPIEAIRLMVNALRKSKPGKNISKRELVGYSTVGDSFSVPSRNQHKHADPLVQKVFENAIVGEIIQAIGRLRALLRQGETLKVFYISDLVLPGVPIDCLIKASIILDPEGLNKKRENITGINATRTNEARNKVEAFLKDNPGAGVNEIHRQTGVRKPVISEMLKASLELIPAGDNVAVVRIITGTLSPGGIETESQFQPITVLEQTKDPEYPEIHIPSAGLPCIPSVSVEWPDDGVYKISKAESHSMEALTGCNEPRTGTRDGP